MRCEIVTISPYWKKSFYDIHQPPIHVSVIFTTWIFVEYEALIVNFVSQFTHHSSLHTAKRKSTQLSTNLPIQADPLDKEEKDASHPHASMFS